MSAERPVVFDCDGEKLVGILHAGQAGARQGVVIVVGGPQYRVGSHRQFVIMARAIAATGTPVFRFDYRGMGDSTGAIRSFEFVESDIHAAVDCMIRDHPGMEQVVLLGLCDAASAILMYLPSDSRISKIILMNPWVHTEAGEAKVYLKKYYMQRFFQKTFWQKLFSGGFDVSRSFRDAIGIFKALRADSRPDTTGSQGTMSFIDLMYEGLRAFDGPVLALISGRDLTASQFMELIQADKRWRHICSRSNFHLIDLPEADHTMSRRRDLSSACDSIVEWLDDH